MGFAKDLRKNATAGVLAALWIMLWIALLCAVTLPWWEHSGLAQGTMPALSRRTLGFDVFDPPLLLGLIAAALLLSGAIIGMLIVAILRLINPQPDLVSQALAWALGAMRPVLPAFTAVALATVAACLVAPRLYWTGFIAPLLAAIYFSLSCSRPSMVASADGYGWWKPYMPPWRVLGLVAPMAISGFLLEQLSGRSLWLDLADLLATTLLSYLAAIVLIFSLSLKALTRLLRQSRLVPAFRAAVDCEIRLSILISLALVPILATTLFLVFVAPNMEESFKHTDIDMPTIVSTLIRLGRALISGYCYILVALALPLLDLTAARLSWLLFAPELAAIDDSTDTARS